MTNARIKQQQIDKQVKHYENELPKMVSDEDIQRYLGQGAKAKTKKYSELANYNNINDLLPDDNDYCIILVESQRNSGHWTCLLKYNDTIESFDSYGDGGGSIDHELSFIPDVMRRMLGENNQQLSKLLKTKNKDKP